MKNNIIQMCIMLFFMGQISAMEVIKRDDGVQVATQSNVCQSLNSNNSAAVKELVSAREQYRPATLLYAAKPRIQAQLRAHNAKFGR